MKPLSGSVGRNGDNRKKDIVRIQAMLNVLPPMLGGPTVLLKLDDMVGPKTIAAIEGFQQKQFAKKDGKVDKNGPTFKKLVELEQSSQIIPVTLRPDSAAIARQWAEAGLWHVNQAIGPDEGPKPKDQVPERVRDLLMMFFGLEWDYRADFSTFRRQVTANDLQFMRDKLSKMKASLMLPGMYTAIEYVQMYNDLTKPQRLQMCSGGSMGPFVNVAFCEPDPVNHIGAAIHFRAAGLFQGSALAGDTQDRIFGVSDPDFYLSGMVAPILGLHSSAAYLFFCQCAAGGSLYYFIRENGGVYSPETRPLK